MINITYGSIPNINFYKYFKFLINKTYKILPLKEESSITLNSYLESYLKELVGVKELFSILEDEPQFITVLCTIQYFILYEYTVDECKKEVFKCIRILEDINNKYFEKGE